MVFFWSHDVGTFESAQRSKAVKEEPSDRGCKYKRVEAHMRRIGSQVLDMEVLTCGTAWHFGCTICKKR